MIGVYKGFAEYSTTDHKIKDAASNDGNDGLTQILLMNTLLHFSKNSGDLVKVNFGTTNQITVDLSEYQKVCEYLVANVKYMIDKFTGLVPTDLLDKVTS